MNTESLNRKTIARTEHALILAGRVAEHRVFKRHVTEVMREKDERLLVENRRARRAARAVTFLTDARREHQAELTSLGRNTQSNLSYAANRLHFMARETDKEAGLRGTLKRKALSDSASLLRELAGGLDAVREQVRAFCQLAESKTTFSERVGQGILKAVGVDTLSTGGTLGAKVEKTLRNSDTVDAIHAGFGV